MAARLPVANGSRATSALSSAMGVLPPSVPSSLKYDRACCSMVSEKSAATTPENLPDLANLRYRRCGTEAAHHEINLAPVHHVFM